MSHPLILPMLIQMSMSILLLFWLAYGRVTTLKKAGGIKKLIAAGGFDKKLINRGDSFKNQFEIPVIFYGLCLLFITAGAATTVVVSAAWVFVVSRFVHCLIQVTNNKIFPNRFLAFLIGALSLIVMIVAAFIQVLS